MTISSQPSPLEIMIDRRQLEIVKYFRYLGSMTTNDIRFIRQINYRIAMARAEFNEKKNFFLALGSCDRASWAKCEERENQQDATIRYLLSTSVSKCFGHHYAHLQENKDRVTAYGLLLWFCWMWLVAVVGRCVTVLSLLVTGCVGKTNWYYLYCAPKTFFLSLFGPLNQKGA